MTEKAITISGLTKDFAIGLRGVKLRAVEDLSLQVGAGEVFGLLGPNGSGKSTTIKMLLGLLKPTRGDAYIFGKNSTTMDSRRHVGYLPEAPYFYRFLSGRELVRYYARLCGVTRREMGARLEAVLELVGLQDAAGRTVGTYSKGMLQRIGLAQAMVHDPDLLILDEPTAGVDPIGAAAIADIIRKLKAQGKTVLLCTHLLAQAEVLCDRVAIINKGRLVVEGSMEKLLTHHDQRSLVMRGLTDTHRRELSAWLAERGVDLISVSEPRERLDDLFLEKVQSQVAVSPDAQARKRGQP